jgi:circadian clock protein KaiB
MRSDNEHCIRRYDAWRYRRPVEAYVAGMTATAQRALTNLKAICELHLTKGYTLSVVDLLENPQQAEDDQIIAVPTVVRELPMPVRKLIGDLSDTERVLACLSLDVQADSSFPK